MQHRLQHLEGLVLALMNGKSPESSAALQVPSSERTALNYSLSTSGSSGSDEVVQERHTDGAESARTLASSFGRIRVDQAETSYVGMGHWTAILDEVRALRRSIYMRQAYNRLTILLTIGPEG